VKAIPHVKKFGNTMYQHSDSSFSEAGMKKEATRLRKMGFNIRTTTYQRDGRTLYSLYSSFVKKQ
jgi:hypothetical protein